MQDSKSLCPFLTGLNNLDYDAIELGFSNFPEHVGRFGIWIPLKSKNHLRFHIHNDIPV